MQIPPLRSRCALIFTLICLVSTSLLADDSTDATPPMVAVPIGDFTVPINSAPTVLNLRKTFALTNVTGKVARFTTTRGIMDLELDAKDYPLNVANFLGYVNNGSYNNTFIHRSISGFIFQGGGYYVAGDHDYRHIPVNGAVAGEHKDSNLRGTIAIALTGDPGSADSGTSEWFLNLADNTFLDTDSNSQGPFTAFGHVIESDLLTMDTIAAVPTYGLEAYVISGDGSADPNAFTDVPLYNFQSSQGTEFDSDLVYVNQVALVPLTPKVQGGPALLVLKVKGNTNPDLVTATINARKLTLTYAPGATGSSTITVLAKNPRTKSKVNTTFTVTVQ